MVQRIIRDRAHAKLQPDRLRALRALDMDWARRMFPGAPDEDILIALHKARYHCTDLPRVDRHQSAQWLRERFLPDALGEPVLPEGQLPV
jgi:hypothetical protein